MCGPPPRDTSTGSRSDSSESVGRPSSRSEPGGGARNLYTITPAGRDALARWFATPPEEPHLHIEGVLRLFYANHGEPADLDRSMATVADQATAMLAALRGYVREYLADGGPMDMLEQGRGGPGERRSFAGRPMFPERLASVALAVDITTRLLEQIEHFFRDEAPTVIAEQFTDPVATRRRLEGILARAQLDLG